MTDPRRVMVNSAQLRKAADLIAEAEPSVLNGIASERPGFLSSDPDDGGVVILHIGILPQTAHRINQRGKVEADG